MSLSAIPRFSGHHWQQSFFHRPASPERSNLTMPLMSFMEPPTIFRICACPTPANPLHDNQRPQQFDHALSESKFLAIADYSSDFLFFLLLRRCWVTATVAGDVPRISPISRAVKRSRLGGQ